MNKINSITEVNMDAIRNLKEDWVTQNPTAPDMPPVVVASRGGNPIAMVVSQTIDRDSSLMAAHVMVKAASADHLVLISDSFVMTAEKEIHLEPGELSRRWEAGDRKDISEALCCLIVETDIEFISLPYAIDGGEIGWGEEKRPELAGGRIPETLKEIMKTTRLIDNPELIEGAKVLGIDDPERQWFHLARAAMELLRQNDYIVIDLITDQHPEWTS